MTALESVVRQRDSMRAEAARADALRAWIEETTLQRAELHRDAAPAELLKSLLEAGLGAADELLDRFGVPFRAEPSAGLDLMVRLPSGRRHPAARLSGGQQVLYALAVRIALGAGRLGFLALDEPTMFLDRRSVALLEPALEWLRRLAAAEGLQCWLVTHEEALAGMFDNVIRL